MANLPELYTLLSLDCYRLLDLYLDLLGGDLDLALEILSEFGLSRQFLRRKKPHQLSAGQRKMFFNALTLATRARVKLLDESFEQLDPAKKDVLIGYLTEDRSVIVLSTHETWLVRKLREWDVVFMFEGMLFGKLRVEELCNAYLVMGAEPGALVVVSTPRVTFSIVREPKGRSLSDILSLDYIYKLV